MKKIGGDAIVKGLKTILLFVLVLVALPLIGNFGGTVDPAHATVTVETARIQYNCNGVTTAYTYPFEILEDDDLLAIKASSSGVETTLVLNTDYTVAGAGSTTGGTVTLTAASTCASGYTLTLLRNIELTQETDYVDGEAFSAESLENAIDRTMLIQQQQQEELNRSMRVQKSSTLTDLTVTPTAGKAIGFNSAATGLTTYNTSSLTTIDFDNLSNYSSINAAITAIGATEQAVVCNTAQTLTANLVIPANIQLIALKGCGITTTGYTLDINGPFEAGLYQVFAGTGTVSFSVGAAKEVYPQWWGAVALPAADQAEDHTSAFQSCFNAASGAAKVIVPAGHYMLNSHTIIAGNTYRGVHIPSNSEIIMHPATYLHALDNASDNYNILHTYLTDNVVIRGGILYGDIDTHIDTGTYAGIGLRIQGATNVWVYDLTATKTYTDGIAVVYDDINAPYPDSENVHLINCKATYNYRNGASIIGLQGGSIRGGEYSNNGGTAPQDGIDVEPNANRGDGNPSTVTDFVISDIIAADNLKVGIEVYGAGTVERVDVINNYSYDNGDQGIVYRNASNGKVNGNTSYSNDKNGLSVYYVQDVEVNNNVSYGNTQSGIIIQRPAGTKTTERVTVNGNLSHSNTYYGIYFAGTAGNTIDNCTVQNNISRANGLDGIIANYTTNLKVAGNTIYGNSQTTDNTYNGIRFTNSANPMVDSNTIRHGGGAAQHQYGILIQSTTDGVVRNNDCYLSGRTANISDAGTRTEVIGNKTAIVASYGSFTAANAVTTTVANANILTSSTIVITPTNAAAGTLQAGANSLYVSAKNAGVSFVLTTAGGGAAAGTETFDYIIY
jgi:parallel beta-helix repeat protein